MPGALLGSLNPAFQGDDLPAIVPCRVLIDKGGLVSVESGGQEEPWEPLILQG